MKKKVKNPDEDKLIDIIKVIGEEHGFANLFKAMLQGAKYHNFDDDLTIQGIIEILFTHNKHNYTVAEYLESDDVSDIVHNISLFGYESVKCQSLAELMKFEAFREQLEADPYQLTLTL